MKTSSLVTLLVAVLSISACETRSKIVAGNVYGKEKLISQGHCLARLSSVESKQLIKNSSFVAIPISGLLTGGFSLLTMAVANASITLDDEINANKIAEACGLKEHVRENTDIALTIASNSAFSAITGSANVIVPTLQGQ